MEHKIQKTTHTNESQSSSAAAAEIVDDLLTEIFLLLPLKSLIRFKSVSKRWQSLISDPGFVNRRNPNPNPATALILQVPTKFVPPDPCAPYAHIVSLDGNTTTSPQIRTLKKKCSIDNDSWPYYCDPTITRSCCNGLILTCRICKTHEHHPMRYEYYVCNPTTNKYSMLPQIPDEPNWMLPMCLAFDPSRSPHYKVVCALAVDTWYKFLVYSSETGCWTKSRVEPFQNAGVSFWRGVYWKGAMHWVNNTKNGKSIYFNPEEDRMSLEMMPTPHNLQNNNDSPNYYYYFGESCGHLHYIAERRSWMMDVYELRSDYSEWFVKYRVDHDPYSSVDRNRRCLCAVVRGKSDDDDSFSVVLVGGKFVRYNFLNKTHDVICEVEGTPLEQCFIDVPLYLPLPLAESLCSVY